MALGDIDLLKEEYLYLQRVVEDFDAKSLEIKKWSVSLAAAGSGVLAFKEGAAILIAATAAPIAFWFTDSIWKSFQRAYMGRLQVIEAAMRGESETVPFQITTSWNQRWRSKGGTWAFLLNIFRTDVMMPHIVIGALPIAVYLTAPRVTALLEQFGRTAGLR